MVLSVILFILLNVGYLDLNVWRFCHETHKSKYLFGLRLQFYWSTFLYWALNSHVCRFYCTESAWLCNYYHKSWRLLIIMLDLHAHEDKKFETIEIIFSIIRKKKIGITFLLQTKNIIDIASDPHKHMRSSSFDSIILIYKSQSIGWPFPNINFKTLPNGFLSASHGRHMFLNIISF